MKRTRKMSRLLSLVLCLCMVLSLLHLSALTVYAAEVSQDGLEVSITTDKDEYAQSEIIVATLTVTNTNDDAVSDVSLESMIPEGYALADGDQAALRVDTLAAGETVTLTVRFVHGQSEGDAPATGDDFALGYWLALFVLMMAGLILLVVKHKVWKQVLSLVLCMSMMLSLIAGVPFRAYAAETSTKTIDISTTVQVGGEPVDIKAFVRYTMAESTESKVHTVHFNLNYEGAPQIAAQQVVHGEYAVQPPNLTREGYEFGYWYIYVSDGMEIVDLSKPITEDLMLYAYWIKEGTGSTINLSTFYKVRFAHPDSLTDEEKVVTYLPEEQLVYEGALVYSVQIPFREGYTFAAWYYDSALTKLAGAADVITKDTVLYPLMVKDDTPVEGMPTNNYVADLDVADLNHSVTVQASSLQAVKDGLVFLDITAGGVEMDFHVTDNGDGTYTVRAAQGLKGGKTYQLRAMDREQLPSTPGMIGVTGDYIRFFHNGELQSTDVIYYNIFTIREEINNAELAGDLVLIPVGDVTDVDMDTVSSLFTVFADEDGGMRMETNEQEGSFLYTGSKILEVGNIVAIYEGGPEVEEEYRTSKTVANAKNTAFLEILAVDGNRYTYRMAELFDVMYFPDLLPIPLPAETDGNPDDNTVTIADSYLDFRYLPIESNILDENTTVDPGDFVAFYSGTLEEATEFTYGKVISVERKDGFTTIVFEDTTYDDIQAAMDSFVLCDMPISFTEGEQIELENQIVQQAIDSGFAENAAAVAVRDKLGMAETPVWGERYAMTREQAQTLGVEIEVGEFDAGMLQFSIDPPDVNANISTTLKRITTMNGGAGLRVTFGVYIPVRIEYVNVITNQVEQSFNMDLYLTLEQELAMDIGVSLDGDIEFFDAWVRLDAYVDLGIYTGVGVVAIIDTQKDYEKQYLWEHLVKDDGSNGAFTSAESLSDQLNSMLSGGDTTFFDMYRDEDGNSTLLQEYRRMLASETNYVDILAIPLGKLKTKITPQVPVAEIVFAPEIVFSAKLNVLLGTSFELMNVKRYGFSLYASLSGGVDAWASPVVDKQTPYHSLNILILGNLGLRAGIRGSFSLGLLSVKLANVGVMLEVGGYVDIYGFGYYHYDWHGATATSPESKNVQSAGAFYVDIGIYVDIDLYGGVLLDMFTFRFHVFELKATLWELGNRSYIYDVEFYKDTYYVTDKSYTDRNSFGLHNNGKYRVKTFNVTSGEIYDYWLDRSQFTITIPEEYQSKIQFFERFYDGTIRHEFWLTPEVDERSVTVEVEITLTSSMKQNRSSALGSLYDLIGPASQTMTIYWTCGQENYEIRYASKGPSYVGYTGCGWIEHPGRDFVTFVEIPEKTQIPNLASINHLAPQVEGMDFAGWEVCSTADDALDGLFIRDVSELRGHIMPTCDVYLYPQYAPRNDTEYTVRHLLPSLADPEEYEVFIEDVLQGTTHSGVDALDFYIYTIPGISIDYNRLPVNTYLELNGQIYYWFDYVIRHDGSLVIDLYYKRVACPVTLYANNPDFVNYSSLPAATTTQVLFGDTVTDPGYSQVQIPGYTFLGWSTTADGSSGIMESLPDSLDFTKDEQLYGKCIYAIWQPEKIHVDIHYYLLDPYGEYQYLGNETQALDAGTKLMYGNLKPTQVTLHEDAYGQKIEGWLISQQGTTPYLNDFVAKTSDELEIHVYYSLRYSNVRIDDQQSYHVYGEPFTLPEPAEKQGYVFVGWYSYYEGGKIYASGETVVPEKSAYWFIPQFVEADDIPYTVKHYKELEDGTYAEVPDETQVFYGTTNSWVSPAVNTYPGFRSPGVAWVQVAPDGSTVVEYRYSRKVFNVRVEYKIEGENVRLDGRHALEYTYGVPFALSNWEYPLTITREGYTFVGWYLADEELNPDCTLLQPDDYWVTGDALFSEKDLVFKPMWEKALYEYRVEHYLEQLNGSYKLQQSDKFTGYMNDVVTAQFIQFTGFTYDATNSGNVLSGIVTTDGSLVLKLYYTRNSYDALWYDYDCTTLLATTRFKYGQTITAPAVSATREGYTFGGWNIGSKTMTASGASYNAKDNGIWTANTYTVVFDANGGEGTMADQTLTYDKVQTLIPNSFTMAGYTFVGWSLSADGEVKYADQAQVTNLASSGKVTLYAQWEAGASTAYKVEYYGEKLDGSGFEVIKTENRTGKTNSDVSADAVPIEGFTYDASNSSNVTSGTITGDGSLVLKLYYSRNSYTLTLDFNGESMKRAVKDWDTDTTVITGFEVADQTITVKYGQTLSEVLTGITTFSMVEEGYSIWDEELGEYVEVEPVYEKVAFETAFPGYEFGTWEGICDTMPAENLTLTAQWTPITITVVFYSGYSDGYAPGVTGTTITQTYSYGDSIQIPEHDFVWSDHTIIGWKLGDGSSGFGQSPEIVESSIELVYGYHSNTDFREGDTLELFPYWASNSYLITVEFNGNGAESGTMDTFLVDGASGTSLIKNKFRRAGYTFVGWNTAADGSGTFFDDGAWISLHSAGGRTLILYAQWEKNEEGLA